jgi:hypothetical protein
MVERTGAERVEVAGMGQHWGWEQSKRHQQAHVHHALKIKEP